MPTQTMPPGWPPQILLKNSWRNHLVSIKKFQISAFNSKQFQRYDTLKFVGHAHFLLPDSAKCTFYVILDVVTSKSIKIITWKLVTYLFVTRAFRICPQNHCVVYCLSDKGVQNMHLAHA